MQHAENLPAAIRDALASTPLTRALQVERAAIDEQARTATIAFASATPYTRWWGREILDVSPTAMRQTRLVSGANLLVDHDTRDVVGVVETVEIGADRVARAVVRFGRSQRAEEVWRDVVEGIRRNVSVGYMIHAAKLVEMGDEEEDDDDTYLVTDWEPYEVSLVSVPADPTVGVGRSLSTSDATATPIPDPISAPAAAEPATPAGTPPAADRAATAAPFQPSKGVSMSDIQVVAERNHAAEISQLAATVQGFDARELALRSIQAGHTVEQFQAEVLRAMANRPLVANVQLNERESQEYSYVRAIAAALARAEGTAVSGLEAELSQDLERQLPANAKRHGGIYVPMTTKRSAISDALYNTSGKGASTVFTAAGEFIDLLRNQALVVGLGARVMSGLTSPVSFPAQTGAATAYWMPENDGTNVTASVAALGAVGLTPKTLQATTAFSRQLMAQSSIDVEQFIRNDLAASHALAWDRAALHGLGSSNQPTGIYAASNVNAVAMGGTPTFGKLVDMITEVLKDNALMGNLAFATTPGMAGKLAQSVVVSSTDSRMVWTGPLTDGQLAGYRAVASNQVLATLGSGSDHGLIFGNWSDVMIGTWGAMEIVVDPYALKKQGMIEVTSFQLCDIALRHPESFCKATGATI